MILNNISDEHKKISFQNELIENYISVIIPVYKDSVGLEETLKSLKKQTLSDQEYEIIVANDGADTQIEDLCKRYNVKTISIYPNQGSYFARNKAIELARGEYIAFVDADIRVPEDWLEKGRLALQKGDYVAGDIIIDIHKIKNIAGYYEYCYGFPVKKYLKYNHFGVTANLFVKREVFDIVGGFDARLKSGGDLEFGDRVFRSNRFKQIYSKDITTIHPPRGYRNLIKKVKRVIKGQKDIKILFPRRFSFYSFKTEIIKLFVPFLFIPDPYRKGYLNKRYVLWMFVAHMEFIKSLYSIWYFYITK